MYTGGFSINLCKIAVVGTEILRAEFFTNYQLLVMEGSEIIITFVRLPLLPR